MRIVFVILIALFTSGCKTPVLIEYDLPFVLSDLERNYVLADLETGRVLYKEHCASCHGIYGKAVSWAPDFSRVEVKTNLEIVLALAISRDPVSHKMTRVMLPDEVNQIMGFIQRYKRQPQP